MPNRIFEANTPNNEIMKINVWEIREQRHETTIIHKTQIHSSFFHFIFFSTSFVEFHLNWCRIMAYTCRLFILLRVSFGKKKHKDKHFVYFSLLVMFFWFSITRHQFVYLFWMEMKWKKEKTARFVHARMHFFFQFFALLSYSEYA